VTKVDDVIGWAQTELGKPYVFGDEGPNAFDCSGLMQYIYAKVGVQLPRTAHEQQAWATRVSTPLPGDLVFYGDPAHHVGLYIGGGKMINAPHKNALVRVDGVGTPTSYGRVPGVGGVLGLAAGAVGSVTSAAGGWVSDLLGGARRLVLEGGFVAFGVVLLAVGGYLAVRPTVHRTLEGITS